MSSQRSSRRAVRPAEVDDLRQALKGISLKNRRQQDEDLPRTVSVGSGGSGEADRCEDRGRTRERSPRSERSRINEDCIVTGRLSNILDDYDVLPNRLGEGHYGTVRECVRRSDGRSLACKSIDKSRIGRLDHLRREVDLLSEMDHKGVMKMVDCYEDADFVHIVTEKYDGGELFDRVVDLTHEGGCYSERTASRIAASLLEAVAYLHDRDIVHRDLKPENVLFESEGATSVRLIDFGLSRRHRDGEPPMTNPVGTAYYMSPELLEGRYDRSCDVWSLGTIVYILLCGYPPFNAETDPEIFEQIRRGRLEFPEGQWGAKSDGAKDFVRCLLRRDPGKRFTAREALRHPWIVNGGRRPRRGRSERGRSQRAKDVRYLRIP